MLKQDTQQIFLPLRNIVQSKLISIVETNNRMIVFHRKDYVPGTPRMALMQEHLLGPYAFFMGLLGILIIYLLAQGRSILIPGVAGIFCIVILGQFFGAMRSRNKFLEIGFLEDSFYLRSAYDVIFDKNLRLYPLAYANPVEQNGVITLNYIDHPVHLRRDEWESWDEIWMRFHGLQGP